MTWGEERGVDGSRGHPREPVFRNAISAREAAETGRRRELQQLLDVVLPEGQAPGLDQWRGRSEPGELLDHDLRLLMALLDEGFEGLIWSELADRLARYGLSVIGAWLVTGEIYERTTHKGRPVRPAVPPLTSDERTALAIDTVSEGIKLFRRRGLEHGDWNPTGGARLSTYFIGACVLCFANLCRQQLTARTRTDRDVFVPHFVAETAVAAPSAERVALGRLGLVDTMLGRNRRAARRGAGGYPEDVVNLVVTYQMLGYHSAEISELISTAATTYSPSTVRKILSDYRKQVEQETREGGRE
ncbi:hypothetical protein [Amycolatopsis sp. NPDC003861]